MAKAVDDLAATLVAGRAGTPEKIASAVADPGSTPPCLRARTRRPVRPERRSRPPEEPPPRRPTVARRVSVVAAATAVLFTGAGLVAGPSVRLAAVPVARSLASRGLP